MENKKTRKIIICTLLVTGICLVAYGMTYFFKIDLKKNINQIKMTNIIETLPKHPDYLSELPYHEPNFYFSYKNKFYYYDYKTNGLYVMNMDSTDEKLITKSSEMEYPSFYLVYKDEAYFYNIEGFYTEEPKTNKKVNLLTGDVTSLDNDYNYLPISFNDGIVTSIGEKSIMASGNDPYAIRKTDLNTNTIDFENTHDYTIDSHYLYDYSSGTIYEFRDKIYNTSITIDIFRNNLPLSSVTIDDIDTKQKRGTSVRYLYVDKNALYLTDSLSLFKYDFETKSVTRTDTITLDIFDIFYSNNNDTVYIYNRRDCYIYVLDKEKVVLNKLFKVTNASKISEDNFSQVTVFYEDIIYDTGSKVILPFNANNLRYLTKVDNSLGTVTIYDKSTKEVRTIENVRRAFFDYENKVLYIFTKKNSSYEVEKIPLDE